MPSKIKIKSKKYIDKVLLKSRIIPRKLRNFENTIYTKNKQAGLIISADLEMAWAFRYSKRNFSPNKMAAQTRENMPILLELFDRFNIPITWATVGHLFLENCKKGDHDWMHRIPYFPKNHKWCYNSGDWFDSDPYSNYKKNNEWYAPDLIENILASRTNHEIGCHTFSHIDFSDQFCPTNVASDEIQACVEAAKAWNIQLKSMVFPGETLGNTKVIKNYNFWVYRRRSPFKFADPYYDNEGLIVTHATQIIADMNNIWPIDYQLWRIEQIIETAISKKTYLHLWFHPSDNSTIYMLKKIIPKLAVKVESGALWLGRMCDLKKLINE